MTTTMRTPRGTFEVELFRTKREITEAGFGLYFTTDDGRDLYTRSDVETWHTDFAAVCTADELAEMEQQERLEEPENENRTYCERIAEELEAIAEGKMYRCTVCEELIRTDAPNAGCPECDGELEQVGMLDYFEDVLDIEYCIGGSGREYRSVCVMVACGGPNVYVNTGTRKVELLWGTDREDFGLSDRAVAAIDDVFEELYNY